MAKTRKPLVIPTELDEHSCDLLERQASLFSRSRVRHASVLLRGLVLLFALHPRQAKRIYFVIQKTDQIKPERARELLRELTRNSSSIPVNSRSIRSSDGRNS